jgi:pimeloyl-ACP methyl ester carboxylesterase
VTSPPGALAYLHQAAAAATHSTFNRLGNITAPTLVVHGEQDVVMPPDNARLLAGRIPGAELRLWPEAGHLYIIDEPRADRDIANFLRRHSGISVVPDLRVA